MKVKQDKWPQIRLRYLFTDRIGGAWGEEPDEDNYTVCIRAADFETDKLRHKEFDLTRRSFKPDEILNKGLQRGDLIIEKSGGGDNQPVGRVVEFSLTETALCSNFLEVLRPNKNLLRSKFGTYLFYSLWSNRLVIPAIKQTTGIQNLDIADYLDMRVVIPGLEQQKSIIDYLGFEISKIENLIQSKESQLTLLAEKRQALITKAVTRGLDSSVHLKASGVEWLGDVPEHWEVKKLKYVADLRSGEFITADSIGEEGPYPVYGGNGLRGYTSSKTHSGNYALIGRQGALCGNINYANGDFWASEHAVVCTILGHDNVVWLGELLRIMNLNQYSVSAAQPGLSVEVLKNLSLPVPSVREQTIIAKHITSVLNRLNSLQSAAERTITLLKERRSALITAAVTGQIDIPQPHVH